MSTPLIVVFGILATLLVAYVVSYFVLNRKFKKEESEVVQLFLRKSSKIPALIEVMRPYVDREEAFDRIIQVHTEVMIESTGSIYDILEHNLMIQDQFAFLMKLSVHIRPLQVHEYFLYIREFVIQYEKQMRARFGSVNRSISNWNRFVQIKNMTLIGYLLPGRSLPQI